MSGLLLWGYALIAAFIFGNGFARRQDGFPVTGALIVAIFWPVLVVASGFGALLDELR